MLAIIYLLITASFTILGLVKRWRIWTAVCYFAFLLVFCAIIPLPGEDKKRQISPTQVVFRFDAYRYLQLTGSDCEGKLYYIDEQKQVYNELAIHSAEVLTEPFAHAVGDYILIPRTDYATVRYSQDGGRTFKSIDVHGFSNIPRPGREQIKGTVVVGNQLFMDTTNGIYRSPKPFGSHIQVDVLSSKDVEYWKDGEQYNGERWQGDITEMPKMPSDYKGWYHWQCDINKKQYEIIYNRYAPLINLQAKLRQSIGLMNKGVQ